VVEMKGGSVVEPNAVEEPAAAPPATSEEPTPTAAVAE
jgi:hypothetical protein